MQEQDEFAGTGIQTRSDAQWLNIVMDKDDNTKLRIGKDGLLFDSFVAKLVGAEPAKRKDPTGKIPARWEYVLQLMSKDTDGQVKRFNLTLSSHWQSSIVSDILNPILWLASQPGSKMFKLNVYSKSSTSGGGNKLMRASVYPFPQINSEFMQGYFPWVGSKTDGHFDGVPKAGTLPDGKPDYRTVADFWHVQWEKLVGLLAGSTVIPAAPQPATPAPQPMPAREMAAPQQPAADTNGLSYNVQNALKWLDEQWHTGAKTDINEYVPLCQSVMKMCKSPNRPQPFTKKELDTLVVELNKAMHKYFVKNIPAGMIIGPEGSLIQDPASGFQTPAADNPTANADDLPF